MSRTVSSIAPMTANAAADARYPWRVLGVTTFGVTLVFLNSSSVSVAVPALSSEFTEGATATEWIVFAFMFALSALILPFGRLSDTLGRRQVYITGLALFTVASLACGFAWSAGALIALRVLQGIAAAAIITNITGQLTDVFSGKDLGKALGYNMMAVSAANVLGPVVGGALIESLGWRALFWVNVPIGVIGLWWAWRTLKRTPPADTSPARFDWMGALTGAIAMAAGLLVLSFGGRWGWASMATIGCTIVTVGSAVTFLLVERTYRAPLVPPHLITRSRMRALSLLAGFFGALPQSAVLVLVAVYFQSTKGWSALAAGLEVVPLAVGIILVAPLSGRLTARLAPRTQGTIGAALTAIGLAVITVCFYLDAGAIAIGVALFIAGIGVGLFTPSNTTAILTGAPSSSRGSVNGVRLVAHNFGLTVGTALALAALASQLTADQQAAAYSGSVLVASDTLKIAFAVAAGSLTIGAVVQVVMSIARGNLVESESPI